MASVAPMEFLIQESLMERTTIYAVLFSLGLVMAGCNDSAVKTRTYSTEKDGTETGQTATDTDPGKIADASNAGENPRVVPAGQSGDSTASSVTGDPSIKTTEGSVATVDGDAPQISGANSQVTPTPESRTESPANLLVEAPVVPSPIDGRPPLVPAIESIAVLTTGEAAAPSDPDMSAYTFPQPGSLRKDPEKREIKLLVPERRFTMTEPNQSLRVSYDDLDLLKVLNMEPVPANAVDHFPKWLLDLDGKQIRLRGFMIPTTREKGLTGFRMARDNQICCFQRTPMVYDVFPVFLKAGETTNYIQNRPFDVVGVFHIRPDVYDGEVENLYEISEAVVIDK